MDSGDTMDNDVELWRISVPEMTCDNCSKLESSNPLKQCSACHLVWYCDSNCQRNHWKYHKPDCQRVTEKKKAIDLGNFNISSSSSSSGPTATYVRFLARSSSSPSREILNLLKEAVLLIERAEQKQPKPSPIERMDYLNKASDKVKQIYEIDPDHSQALFLAAQIYQFRNELNASIVALEDLLDPRFGPLLITDDEDKIMILVMIGKSYLRMRNFCAALPIYGQAWDVYENACKCCMKSSNQKLILSGICQCSYEVGDYDEAIETGLKAIWFNRHYNESYEFVIKSYKQLGKWDMAMGWVKRALRYEAPWNEDIVKRNKQLNEELIVARDAAIAKQIKVRGSSSSSSSSNMTNTIHGSSSSSSGSSSSSSRHFRARHKMTTMSSTLDL